MLQSHVQVWGRRNGLAGAMGSLLSPLLQTSPLPPPRAFWEKFSVQGGPLSLLGVKIRNIALQPPWRACLPWTALALIAIIYI